MKIIHVADLHANKERKDEVLHVLDTLLSRVQKRDIDYLLFAGDFWDSTITNTAASGFPEFVFKVQEIAALTDVIMISGTPLHEPYGSLDIFRTCGVTVCDNISFITDENVDLLCLPEPRRSDYVKKTSKEIDTLIKEQYTNVIKNTQKGLRPLIILYHGDIESAVYQNGFKVSTQTAISQELLKSTNADYIACGHVHKKQELFENCWYSGSCYLKNSGETHDCGYNLVTIENGKTTVECISFGFPQNETVICTEKDFDKLIEKDFTGKNITIKLQIDKALKNISSEEKLELIKEKTNARILIIEQFLLPVSDKLYFREDLNGKIDITPFQLFKTQQADFFANASHELKTPITSIMGYADTLLEGEYDKDTQNRFLNVIAEEARRMAKLVTDLLTLSRFDNNQILQEKVRFDLGNLVKQCQEKVQIEIDKKGHKVECFVTADVPKVYADKEGIERVVLNILTNSIKYTPDGGEIKIYVGFVYNDAYIKVIDNGLGIPEEDLNRIFERFYRVDKARTRQMGGTGLGLSIAKEILDKNNGTIDIKSEKGKGTEVVIRIPTK